ncbi:hypothetical protein PQ472_07590 [Lacticaseibacillus pabuli]|uniref:Uncharacterized protein n=1 Tax=Lacticaseibacillus pabuli TaxID=3025672 RepID=A0ABY7WS28_9LACO|nr:hypothetical protein [Lacticaseibacillus sp. KACC 23028]WDF81786.1 hypothetical protein PQ472_07590 [Lacticaseibacillus sp. KACC 23028]
MNEKHTTTLGIITTATAGAALLASALGLAAGILTIVTGTKNQQN